MKTPITTPLTRFTKRGFPTLPVLALVALAALALTLFASGSPPPAQAQQQYTITVTPAQEALDVSWTQVQNALSYTVRWKSGGQDYSGLITGDRTSGALSGATSYRITGLTAGTTYTVKLTVQLSGTSFDSAEATGAPLHPIPGVNVTSSDDGTALTVTWDEVTGRGSVAYYGIRWKSGSEEYLAWPGGWGDNARGSFVASTARTFTIPKPGVSSQVALTPGTEHTIEITARGFHGRERARTETTAATAEFRVLGVTAAPSLTTANALDVLWDAAPGAQSYNVLWKGPGEDYHSSRVTTGITTTSTTITGLTAGTVYTVSVRAVRSGQQPSPHSEAIATPQDHVRPVAKLVSNTAESTSRGPSSVGSSRRAQGFVTGPNTNGYGLVSIGLSLGSAHDTRTPIVQLWSASGANPSAKIADLASPTLTASSSGVQAFTAPLGTVLAANTRYFLVVSCPTGAGSSICLTAHTIESDAEDSGSAQGWSIDNNSHRRLGPVRWATDTDSYRIAVNGVALGTALPEVPGLSWSLTSDRRLTVNWANADAIPASNILDVQWKSGTEDYASARTWRLRNQMASGTTTVPGPSLRPDASTAYTVRVTFYNRSGDDPGSTVYYRSEFMIIPEVPNLTVTSNSLGNALVVNWGAVTGAVSYAVHWKSGGQSYTRERRIPLTSSPLPTTATIPNLTAGTTYTVRVQAAIPGGPEVDAESEVTGTPMALPEVPVVSTTSNSDATALTINWTAPTGVGSIAYYGIRWKSGGEDYLAWPGGWGDNARGSFVTSTVRTFTIPKSGVSSQVALTKGTEYTIQITARSSSGIERALTEYTATPALPAVPGFSVASNAAKDGLVVNWNAVSGDSIVYLVQWKSGQEEYSDTDSVRRRQLPARFRTFTIPSLTVGTEYTVRLTALSSGEKISESEATATIPLPEIPGLTATSNAAGTGLVLTWNVSAPVTENGLLNIRWKSGQQAYEDLGDGLFIVSPRSQWESTGNGRSRLPVNLTEEGRVALTPFTEYMVLVDAVEPGQTVHVARSEVTVRTGGPEVPGLTVTSNDAGNALVVNWNTTQGASSYLIQWKSGGQAYSATTRMASHTTGRTHTITGLTAGRTYTVRIKAYATSLTFPSSNGIAESETTGTPTVVATTPRVRPPSTGDPTTGTRPFKFLAGSCEPVALVADGTFNGRWDDDPDCPSPVSAKSVSRFYKVVLPEGQSTINFTLEGGGPRAKMRLWPEWTKNHVAIGDADDPMHARFLRSGAHYLEVEHGFKRGSSGDFRITMSGMGAGPANLSCAETSWTFTGSGNVKGRWDAGCGGNQPYREYRLMLSQPQVVTIEARSANPNANPDPRLRLSTGVPPAQIEQNQGTGGVSRISRTLEAGQYGLILDNSGHANGVFTLDIAMEAPPPVENCEQSYLTITGDRTITGKWDTGCSDGQATPTHRRYYDLLVRERGQVTLTLDSTDADPFLNLSRISYDANGSASLSALASNDDYRRSKSQSRITRNLTPGRYRVEARTKNAEETGGFSLTVAGLGTDNALACAETYQSFTAPHAIQGRWDHGCEAARTPDQQPRYHRYYDLEVGRLGGLKTIVLTSSDADPVLSLYRFAADGSQTFVATNDDDGGSTSRSRIAGNLDWGRYRIYVAPKNREATGAFTLKVVEGVEVYGQWNSGSDVVRVPLTISGNVKVSITSPAGYSTDLHFDKAGGGTESSVRTDAGGIRSDRDASLTLLRVPNGAHTIRALLHPEQLNDVGNFVPIGTRNFRYPIQFTLNYNTFNSALYTPPGGAVDSPPRVTDKSQFKTHEATVGEAFALVLPAAVPGSGNGGPYQYSLWKRNVNGNIMYLSAFGENGLSFNASTRTLAGTPAAEGTHLLAYRIHDGDRNFKGSDSFLEMTHLQIVVSAAVANGDSGPQPLRKVLPPPNTMPNFDPGLDTALTVAENSPAGTNVGAPIAATDPDEGDTLTYSLTGEDAAKFAIDSAGQVTTIAGVAYDYERRSYLPEPAYSLTVNVSDGSGSGAAIPVTVTLTDVDDDPVQNLPPEFHEGTSTTREVAEGSPADTNVGKPVTAFDANGDTLEYIGFDVNGGALFNLDSDTGQITTKDGVTYSEPSYDLMLIVMEKDTAEGYLTGITVIITFTEAEEEEDVAPQQPENAPDTSTDSDTTEPANTAPSFASGVVTALKVDENSAAGTNVGAAITATDPDEGDTVTYSLTGTDAASFDIGSSTGQIATKAGVTYNHEAKSSYSLTVKASDGELSDTIAATVSLNDVAEAPTVSDTTAFKTHYATVGSKFTLTLPAADAHSGDGGPYTYILWHKGEGKNFATEAVNGLSFDAATRTLSGTPEAEGTWQLNYVVHDGDDNRNAAADAFRERDKLKIVVAPSGQATGDGNAPQESKTEPANTAPSFVSGVVTALKVDENSAAGTNVGSAITATDPDEGDTVTYSLTGTDAASFEIGSSTGQITTKTGVTYDYETKSSYSFAVDASDGKLSDSIDVTVSLNNVNEAPEFAEASATRKVAEHSAAGTNVGDPITATDPDANATLTYSLTGTDAASFDIGSSTGQITAKTGVNYDFEAKSSYSLTVNVSDGKLRDSIDVTVNLTDVNEAPEFAEASATRKVAEHSAAGTNVGDPITATDPDANATLIYSLTGTDAASFDIGSSTGQITTKTGVNYDFETKSSYSLTVTASDGKLTDSIDVTVNLTDVAETAVTACTTDLGALTARALYAGKWDDAECKAHHQDGRARYFEFTLSADATVTISLSEGTLYVSKDKPNNGWGKVPGPGYEHRINVRTTNGKLLHDGPAAATATNDGNTVTLNLKAGVTYTAEAVGTSGGTFAISIAP